MTDKAPMTKSDGGSVPSPDPTVLTTSQLLREVESAVKYLESRLISLEAEEQALIKGMRGEYDVRFHGIEREFIAIENWRKEQKLDTKTAVDAALQAAEKAVREQTVSAEKSILKSETSANEQSKQQYATFSASLKGVADTLADVKSRVDRMEANKIGAVEVKTAQSTNIGTILGILGGMVGLIAVVMAIAAFIITNTK